MDIQGSKPRARRRVIVAAAVLGAAAGGATLAFAQHVQHAWHGHGVQAASHQAHLRALLAATGASEPQLAEIEALLAPALTELEVMHDAHSAALGQLLDALGAPVVDPARIEALRAEQLRTIDAASQRFVAALGRAAEVLSLEQRAALIGAIAAHHGG